MESEILQKCADVSSSTGIFNPDVTIFQILLFGALVGVFQKAVEKLVDSFLNLWRD